MAYQEYNKFLQSMNDKSTYEQAEATSAAFEEAVAAREATLNKSEGESLSLEDLSEVYIQVKGDQRARNNMALNTRTKTGEINDYLEVRRPFGAAAN